jgi:hypothetical protein
MRSARVPCNYCPSSVEPGEPCSSCGKVTTKRFDPSFVHVTTRTGRVFHVPAERVHEGELQESPGTGLYFLAPLSPVDTALLTSALLGS